MVAASCQSNSHFTLTETGDHSDHYYSCSDYLVVDVAQSDSHLAYQLADAVLGIPGVVEVVVVA